jgi:molecular chaperone DnaK
MIPLIGIDLGTTFSCMSYIDENGVPTIIKNSDGQDSTPSVIWFDGKVAYVGKKANDRKIQANSPIYEFVKRDIGRDVGDRYTVNGFNFGACGFSAITLKKLHLDAFNFFKRKNLLSKDDNSKDISLPAVITVPAYFGDKARQETRLAGIAAGFDVIAIINEPTAAALTYGINLVEPKKILVFDLGGGTFDVTIIEIQNGEAKVLTSDGADQLGGKDWDSIIEAYLISEFEKQTGTDFPYDMGWDLQKMALDAKFSLTDNLETEVIINANGATANITLHREETGEGKNDFGGLLADEDSSSFYFEERSQDKLMVCKAVLANSLQKVGLSWNDFDEIILAGGSCRMPMIPKMLENLSKRKIKTNIPGFNLDTAISQGAAIFGRNRQRVVDVTSKSIGIELRENNRKIVEHLIKKDSPLPISISQTFPAEANAVLKVYEGESKNPDDCDQRGRLELGNPKGVVTITLNIDISGVIHASVEAENLKAELKIRSSVGDIDVGELKSRIEAIEVRL